MFARLQELGAIDLTATSETASINITPLLSGAVLAMSRLLDVLTHETAMTHYEGVIRRRHVLG